MAPGPAACGGTPRGPVLPVGARPAIHPGQQSVMKPTRPSLPVGARPAIHPGQTTGGSPGGGSAGDSSRPNNRWWNPRGPVLPVGARPAIHPGQTTGGGTHAAQFSRWGLGRRSIPAKQPVVEPTRPSSPGGGSAGDPSRLNRVAARRSSLRFGRNTRGIPPSRALSAGRLPGLGAHAGSTTGCSPRRCAPLVVAFRSKYTRASSPGGGSSLTRLVSRTPTGRTAPPRPRRSRGFHHRLFTASLRAARRCVSVEIHPGQFSRWGLLPHAPCQPDPHRENWASPASALTRVPPPAVHRVAARRSSLRFGRNTPGPVLPVGAPPSRALSAGRLPGLGAHAGSTTGC